MSRAASSQDYPSAHLPSPSVTRPEGIRFSVTGNVLDIKNPRKPWREQFGNLVSPQGHHFNPTGIIKFGHPQNQTTLQPVPFSDKTLSAVGKKPADKVRTTSWSILAFNSHFMLGSGRFPLNNREFLCVSHFQGCPRVRSSRPPCTEDYVERDECYRELLMGMSSLVAGSFTLI